MNIKEFVNHFGETCAKLYNSMRDMEDTKELLLEQKLIHAVSDILVYITKNECLDDEELISLKIALSKLFENAKNNVDVIFNSRKNAELFSIKEWNTASEERKLSIISFILAAIKPNQIKADDYESTFNQFDKETLEWLKNNTPYEEVRESLAYHYCKDDKNE